MGLERILIIMVILQAHREQSLPPGTSSKCKFTKARESKRFLIVRGIHDRDPKKVSLRISRIDDFRIGGVVVNR